MTGSERVKLARQRQRNGIMFLGIEIRPSERDALVRIGLVNKADRDNKNAVRNAVYDYFDDFFVSANSTAQQWERIMTSDPTGTVGLATGQDNNLGVAVKGGPKFTERLQQLADALDRNEQALVQLRLGQDAKSAFDDAQRKRTEAEDLRKQAADALAEARAKAKKIIEAAKAERAAAVEISANANALQADVDKRLAQVALREVAADKAIAKATRAEAEANRMHDDLKRRIDYLQTKMREIAA